MSKPDEEELVERVRRRVRQGLEDHDMSQFELAQVAGISEKHLSRLMTGKSAGSMAVWDRLLRIAEGGK